MTEHAAETLPRLKARIAGALYLFVIIAGVFAEIFVRERLMVSGDAGATARNILAHQQLFRLGFAAELLACAFNMPLAVILYALFKPVRRTVALLVVFFALVGSAVEAAALLNHFAVLILLGSGPSSAAFQPEQMQALAYATLRMQSIGFAAALVFFGFYCLSLGYLIFKSTFMPRIIGVLLAIEGLCYLVNSFANFLAPEFADKFLPYLMVSGVAEILLCLWLLVMGVSAAKWQAEASAWRASGA